MSRRITSDLINITNGLHHLNGYFSGKKYVYPYGCSRRVIPSSAAPHRYECKYVKQDFYECHTTSLIKHTILARMTNGISSNYVASETKTFTVKWFDTVTFKRKFKQACISVSKGTSLKSKPYGLKNTLQKTSSVKNCVVKNKTSKKTSCRRKKNTTPVRAVANLKGPCPTKPSTPLNIQSNKVTKQATIPPQSKKIRDCASKPMNGCDGLKGNLRSYHTPANIMYSQKDFSFRAKETFFSVSARFSASKCPSGNDKTAKTVPTPCRASEASKSSQSANGPPSLPSGCPAGSGKTSEKLPPANCPPGAGKTGRGGTASTATCSSPFIHPLPIPDLKGPPGSEKTGGKLLPANFPSTASGTGTGGAGSDSTCTPTSSPSSFKTCPNKTNDKSSSAKSDACQGGKGGSYLADCRSQRNRIKGRCPPSREKSKAGVDDSYLADCRSRRNHIIGKPRSLEDRNKGVTGESYLADCRTPRNRIKGKCSESCENRQDRYLADCRSRRYRIQPVTRGMEERNKGVTGESYLADCRSRRNRIKGKCSESCEKRQDRYLADCRSQRNRIKPVTRGMEERNKGVTGEFYLADCRTPRNRIKGKCSESCENRQDRYLADCRTQRNRIKGRCSCSAKDSKGGAGNSYLADCRSKRNRIKGKSSCSGGGAGNSYLADCRSKRNRINPRCSGSASSSGSECPPESAKTSILPPSTPLTGKIA